MSARLPLVEPSVAVSLSVSPLFYFILPNSSDKLKFTYCILCHRIYNFQYLRTSNLFLRMLGKKKDNY